MAAERPDKKQKTTHVSDIDTNGTALDSILLRNTTYCNVDPEGDVILIATSEAGATDTSPDTSSKEKGPEDGGPCCEGNEADSIDATNTEHRIRVSSKILMLTSLVFKAMLQPRFQEGALLASEGTVELTLGDDNAEALTEIMMIIHARSRSLTADLQQLYHIAVLVDKYDMLEVMHDRIDICLQRMRQLVESKGINSWDEFLGERFLLAAGIFWVLRDNNRLISLLNWYFDHGCHIRCYEHDLLPSELLGRYHFLDSKCWPGCVKPNVLPRLRYIRSVCLVPELDGRIGRVRASGGSGAKHFVCFLTAMVYWLLRANTTQNSSLRNVGIS
jgi:hypothetical protein